MAGLTLTVHEEGPKPGPFVTVEILPDGSVDIHAAKIESDFVGLLFLEIARAIAEVQPSEPPAETQTEEIVKAAAECPNRAHHGIHRYCPSCPWTEALGNIFPEVAPEPKRPPFSPRPV